MGKPARPCTMCGGPKSGQGARYCAACREKLLPPWQRASYKDKATNQRRELRLTEPDQHRRLRKDAPAGQKWCPQCRQYLPLADFGKNRTRKDGLSSYCEDCNNAVYFSARLKKLFGIDRTVYDAILEAQDGRCYICLGRPRTQRLAVDHDHRTGEIRGLLCKRCNQSLLGAGHDSPVLLRRAVTYLENPPARAVLAAEGETVADHVRTAVGWMLLQRKAVQAEKKAMASGGSWAVIGPRPGGSVAESFVTMPLWAFANLLADEEGLAGAIARHPANGPDA